MFSLKQAKNSNIYRWLVLLTVGISNFMGPMDASMTNIAIPEFTVVFNTSLATAIWVLLSYMLTTAGLMLTLGKMGDMLGRKRLYSTGFALFTLGLALCAISQSIIQLILFRIVQGVGAAMMVSMGTAIVTATFGAKERGKAIGITGTAVGLGLMSGPALGGLFLDTLGWRSIFYLMLPLSILGTVMAWVVLKADNTTGQRRGFDIWGAAALFFGLASLLFAVNQGQARGWASTIVLTSGAVGAVLMLLFIVIEGRIKQPIVDLSLFRNRLFALANGSLLLTFLSRRGIGLLMPFLLIQASHFSASRAGLLLITIPLSMAVISPLSGWLSDKIGTRLLCPLGLAIVTVGMFLLRDLDADSTWMDIVLPLLIMGIGGSLFEIPNNSSIMGAVRQEGLGTASAMIATMRTVGQSAGIAITAAIFSSRQLFYGAQLGPEEALVASFKDTVIVAFFIGVVAFLISMVQSRIPGYEEPAGDT